MEIKIQCGCGTKYKFDVEPVNGCMPVRVQCPGCGSDGTTDANQILARSARPAAYSPPPSASSPPPPPASPPRAVPLTPQPQPVGAGLRISGAAGAAMVAEALFAPAPRTNSNAALLERTTFFVKERVALVKLTDTYDILDPQSGQNIAVAKEEPPVWAKWLRLVIKKHQMPTAINLYEFEGLPPVLSVRRGFTFIRTKINVFAGSRPLGYFKSKLLSIGGGFYVYDHADQQVAEVKGNLVGWEFRFLNKNGREIGTVSKKWAGLARELLSSADNYVISLTDLSGAGPDASALLLAAGLAIDVVYKEDE